MAAAAPSPSNNVDLVLTGPPEIQRSSEQYLYLRDVFDHTELLPPIINTDRLHRVLDVGAGTGVWALDLTDDPNVRPRLSPRSANPVEIYICDISTSRFPPAEVLRSLGIRAFQQDITEPFPRALHGTFDLVHMSSLAYTLDESQWKVAIKHIHDVLKPGGYLVLLECDPISYTPARPPPADGQPHDVSTAMSGPSAVSKINCVLTGMALKSRFLIDPSIRLPYLLQQMGLQPIAKERAICPYGELCSKYTGLRGSSLYTMRSRSVDVFCDLLDRMTKLLLRRGWLEAPLGVSIQSEEARRALSDELRRATAHGILIVASEWVAQRPARRA